MKIEQKAGLTVLILLLVVSAVGFSVYASGKGTNDGKPVFDGKQEKLFTPLTYASLERVNAKQFCVTTLPNKTDDYATFCTDFLKVHVFVSDKAKNGNGTYAEIDSRWAKTDDTGTTRLARFTDFITVYVQTEAERKQYQDEIDYYRVQHYVPRAVRLDTPHNTPPSQG